MKLTTHQSRNGQWSFRFRAGNGRTVASGDGYATPDDMRRGIEEAETALRMTNKDLERLDDSTAWFEHVGAAGAHCRADGADTRHDGRLPSRPRRCRCP